jgi:hypothetical protein
MVAASLAAGAAGLGSRLWRHFQDRRTEAKAIEDDNKNVLLNLQTLDPDEVISLLEALSRPQQQRFGVENYTPAFGLVGKGVLRVVRQTSSRSFICELHPAIVRDREQILQAINRHVGRR